jgi:hypothetical protein
MAALNFSIRTYSDNYKINILFYNTGNQNFTSLPWRYKNVKKCRLTICYYLKGSQTTSINAPLSETKGPCSSPAENI